MSDATKASDVICPWCGEEGFDLWGLKGHIENRWCEPYNEIKHHVSIFQEPTLAPLPSNNTRK